MSGMRPQEIKASHLARAAIVYVRQSTVAQLENNRGSTEYQRSQRRYAEQWGWPNEAIHVIESDLGLSGASAAHRQGYLSLVEEIKADRVGIVLASDYTRLGRHLREWLDFLEECTRHDVMIANDGKVVDLTDNGALLSTRLLGLMAEFENTARRDHIRRGIAARVASGKAVTAPPVGYVSIRGDWEPDTDGRVRDAVSAVFRIFREQRSCAKTVKELNRLGIELPRKQPGHPIRWVKPHIGAVRQFLKNPRYVGCYVYRQYVCDALVGRNSRGQPKLRKGRDDETIVIENHHIGYVTPTEWEEIQEILRLRAPLPERRNLGPGSALLQGLVRCGQHGCRAMSVGYRDPRRDGRRRHYYVCMGDYRIGGPQCGHTSGLALDAVVIDELIQRLGQPSLAMVQAAWKQARAAETAGRYVTHSSLNQAKQRQADSERRYNLVDPANRLLAHDLERKLEAAMVEVQRLERDFEAGKTEMTPFTDESFEELIALSDDVRRLFDATTTTNEERKEIARSLILRVVVDARASGRIDAHVVWEDQSPDTAVMTMVSGRAAKG